jgi:hypothetical protein
VDASALYILLVFGLAGAVCVGILAVGVVIGFVVFRQSRATAQAFATEPEFQGEAFLRAAMLRPWSPGAWADLSSRWQGWWRNVSLPGRQEGYAQGIVMSLAEPVGPGWLSFTLQRWQVRNAALVLRTAERRLEMNVSSQGPFDANVQAEVTLDGVPAGTVQVTYPACLYRSADGAVEARWTGEVRWNNERRITRHRLLSRDVNYDGLTVNGRPVAALTDTWIRYPHPESSRPIHPALKDVASSLRPAEATALLVAIGMGLYYDSLRNRKYVYDW